MARRPELGVHPSRREPTNRSWTALHASSATMLRMNDPIQWGRSSLTWSPPSDYRLTLTVWLAERASAIFEHRLRDALQTFDDLRDATYEFDSGALTRDGRGTNAEPAILTIVAGRTLFAIPPSKLREVLSALAVDCRLEADEQ